jgi:ATP-dependent RNA helicase RhlE
MPNTTDAYIHRIGRTGRAAHSGDAFTLITSEDNQMVNAIDRIMGSRVERRTLKDFDYTPSAPQKTMRAAPGRDRPGNTGMFGLKKARNRPTMRIGARPH